MRAVTVAEYAATPSLVELPIPEPGPGEILIKLQAIGVNPMDWLLASGAIKPMPAQFPMVLGTDGAGVVEQLGEGASKFAVGERLFGQFLVGPIGSTGTYAEYVAVTEDALLAPVPSELDETVAAALPTAGMTGLKLVDLVEPLADRRVLIVGAGGGVGSFATQFAASAGGKVIANVRADDAERARGYGAVETIDHTDVALPDWLLQTHPDGIDALIDLVDDAPAFDALTRFVKPGGTAITTQFVADEEALRDGGITAVNFRILRQMSRELLARVAQAVASERIASPPIRQITLEEAAASLDPTRPRQSGGKTVITL